MQQLNSKLHSASSDSTGNMINESNLLNQSSLKANSNASLQDKMGTGNRRKISITSTDENNMESIYVKPIYRQGSLDNVLMTSPSNYSPLDTSNSNLNASDNGKKQNDKDQANISLEVGLVDYCLILGNTQ